MIAERLEFQSFNNKQSVLSAFQPRKATLNTMHTDIPGFEKCQRLPSDISRNPTYPHISNQEGLFVPNQPSPTLMLKVPDLRRWAYTNGSCHIQNGKQEIGASVYCTSHGQQKLC
eukprot:714016-Pelagomonas_calceolata.AAC.1